jgi:ABC-type dipeptide/oligopeptide/nickel transport system permease component
VTVIALIVGFSVTGSILVETVFSWPGMGHTLFEAVGQRDYPMLQGAFLVLTLSVVMVNYAVDLLYFKLDPRTTVHDARG